MTTKMTIDEIKEKVGEAFLYKEAIFISFRDCDKSPRWCVVESVNSQEFDIKFDTVLNDGLFITASATISYKDILEVSI